MRFRIRTFFRRLTKSKCFGFVSFRFVSSFNQSRNINQNAQNDPRLLTREEYEEYADLMQAQLKDGVPNDEKMDFESPAFKALPPTSQYQMISAARLRSRLRMGLTVDQLETQFPDRLQFSKFQIDRVKQRNYLTQKLMGFAQLDGPEAKAGSTSRVGRVAGQRGREYVLQKSENGWTLALENEENSNVIKIDVDDTEIRDSDLRRKAIEKKREEEDDDDEVEWEDVVPKATSSPPPEKDYLRELPESLRGFETTVQREQLYESLRQKAAQDTPASKPENSTAFIIEDDSDGEAEVLPVEPSKPTSKPRDTEQTSTLDQVPSFKKSLFARAAQNSTSASASTKKPSQSTDAAFVPPWFSKNTSKPQPPAKEASAPFSIGSESSEEDEGNDELVSYDAILEQRQQQVYLETTSNPSTTQEGVVIEIDEDEEDAADDSIQILEQDELGRLISKPPAKSTVAAQDSVVEKESAPPLQTLKPAEERQSSPLEESLGEPDKVSEEEAFVPTHYSKEHQDELARQEEEYGEQEDEELIEQLQREIEETHEFTESLKSSAAPDIDNSRTMESFDEEISSLRRKANKEMRDADEVTPEMVEECQELLKRFGIPFITAPMEAEAQCAVLMSMGLVDGIVTDDSDCFLFGGTKVFKNMFSQGNNKYVECYETADMKRDFGLDQHKLINLALLLGSDYTDGVAGVGPVTAMEILANFDTEDGLVRFRDWWKRVQLKGAAGTASSADHPETAFERKFKKNVTKIFLSEDFPSAAVEQAYVHPEVDRDATPFEWGVPDLDALRTFLGGCTGWSEDKTDELLVPVIRAMNKKLTEASARQTHLKDFFLAVGSRGEAGGSSSNGGGGAPGRSNRMSKAISAMSGRMRRRQEEDLVNSSDEDWEDGGDKGQSQDGGDDASDGGFVQASADPVVAAASTTKRRKGQETSSKSKKSKKSAN